MGGLIINVWILLYPRMFIEWGKKEFKKIFLTKIV